MFPNTHMACGSVKNVTHPHDSPIHGNRGMQSKNSQQCEPVHIQPRKRKVYHAKQVVIDKGISLNKSILRVISYDMLYIISVLYTYMYIYIYYVFLVSYMAMGCPVDNPVSYTTTTMAHESCCSIRVTPLHNCPGNTHENAQT